MINNIGSTTLTLSTIIGNTINATNPISNSTIAMISGELAIGAMISDTDGTVAIVSNYNVDASENQIFTLKTITTQTEFDVESILSQSY